MSLPPSSTFVFPAHALISPLLCAGLAQGIYKARDGSGHNTFAQMAAANKRADARDAQAAREAAKPKQRNHCGVTSAVKQKPRTAMMMLMLAIIAMVAALVATLSPYTPAPAGGTAAVGELCSCPGLCADASGQMAKSVNRAIDLVASGAADAKEYCRDQCDGFTGCAAYSGSEEQLQETCTPTYNAMHPNAGEPRPIEPAYVNTAKTPVTCYVCYLYPTGCLDPNQNECLPPGYLWVYGAEEYLTSCADITGTYSTTMPPLPSNYMDTMTCEKSKECDQCAC